MDVDAVGAEVLGQAECFRLLAGGGLGRVAISVGALPAILPVRFVLDDGEIVFRAGSGTVLGGASRGTVVAFEADGVEDGAGTWSVLVTGLARHITDAAELARADALPLPQWSTTGSDHVVAVTAAMISGRRLVTG
jgi:uncharacterized protein